MPNASAGETPPTATLTPIAPTPTLPPARTSTSTALPTVPFTTTPTSTALPTATSPAPLLAPPAPDDGFQLTMSGFEVPAGGETEVCQLLYLPNDAPIDVDHFEIAMPDGSHHFVVWGYNGARADQYPPGLFHATGCIVPRPDDSMNLAILAAAGTPHAEVGYPPGIGFNLAAHQPVLLNSHYANAGETPLYPTVYVNFYYARQPVIHPVESLTAINYKIFVPPGESRTTQARFTLPFDAYFLDLSSHMHKRGDLFTARLAAGEVENPGGRISSLEGDAYSGQPGRRPAAGDFYRSPDWANPTVLIYDEPRFYPAGSVVEFACTQHNDKSVPLGFGPLADDEMCMLTGNYYRAETAPPRGTRIPGCLPQAAQLTCYAEPAAPVAPGTAVCGNGRREAGEECDLGDANGTQACSGECQLELSAGANLGTRTFPIVFSGPNGGTSDFINSVTRSSAVNPSLGVAVSGDLKLRSQPMAANGAVPLSQDAEVRIGFSSLGGGALCVRVAPGGYAGTLHCRGGVGVDLASQIDNLDGMARATQATITSGLGSDGGPGSALLLLATSIVNIAGSPDDCLTRDWSGDPLYPLPFTTGTSTGTITNADRLAGSTIVMSATGENFDCARWSDEGAPGILQALPFLSPNTVGAYNGDVIAQLTLAGHESETQASPTPTPTPAGTVIGGEFAAIAEEIFAPRCALPSCHSSQARSGGLDLERNSAFDELVGVPPENEAARQTGMLRVAGGEVENSFLLRKLSGDLSGVEGGRMPLNAAALSPSDIARIRAWIAAGAQPGS